jgi:hypothetical protein
VTADPTAHITTTGRPPSSQDRHRWAPERAIPLPFINGIGQGTFAVNALTARHLAAPPGMATITTAVHQTVTWGVLPIGSAVAGAVGTVFGLRVAMLAAAGTTALCMIPLLASRQGGPARLARLPGAAQPFSARFLDVRPQAVVRCATPDVAETIG